MLELIIWGSRGSVPVSGARYHRYGGATTCLEVRPVRPRVGTPPVVVLDCGSGLVDLGRARAGGPSELLILQSHLHWDHVQGFPFFGPLFDPACRLELWAAPRDGQSLRDVLDRQMSRPSFPIGLGAAPASLAFCDVARAGRAQLGELAVTWCEVAHPSGCTAWRLDYRGASLVFSGDVEARPDGAPELAALSEGADVLVMDAQYTDAEVEARRGWGHSTPRDAVDLARRAGVGHLVLTHHDPSHDDGELDRMGRSARAVAGGRLLVDNAYDRYQTMVGGPDGLGVAPDGDGPGERAFG